MSKANIPPNPPAIPGDCSAATSAAVALSYPPLPMFDAGGVHFGGKPSMCPVGVGAEKSQVNLGGQAPLFGHDAIADAGLVRLGGTKPDLLSNRGSRRPTGCRRSQM